MKKSFLIVMAIAACSMFWLSRSARGLEGGPPPPDLTSAMYPGLQRGDTVTLHLAVASHDSVTVEGVLRGFDGQQFCVGTETKELASAGDKVFIDHRRLTAWVPRANVLYLEKVDHESREPATQP